MKPLYLSLAILAGAVIPLQAGINARAAAHLGHPAWATLVNFVGGAVLPLLLALSLRPAGPGLTMSQAASVPWWAWLGGLCGCTLVFFATLTVKPLGFLGLAAGLLLGQLVCSVVLDHTGTLREHAHPITAGRALGLFLLVAGFWLINRS